MRWQERLECAFLARRRDDAGSLQPSEERQRSQGGAGVAIMSTDS
jgi:hypothetical protein